MRKLLALASVPVLSGSVAAGCGSEGEGGSSADTGTNANSSDTGTTAETPPLRARLVELTDHRQKGKRWRDTARGAFDWDTRKGWAEMRSGKAASVIRIVQLGDECFRRSDKAAWKQSRPTNPSDSPYLKGLCDWQFRSPRVELRFLHAEVGECCPDKVQVLGLEEVGGVRTALAHLGGLGAIARMSPRSTPDEPETRAEPPLDPLGCAD
jgi:hypothetical protein